MIKLYTAKDAFEANYIARMLRTEGIECYFKKTDAVDRYWTVMQGSALLGTDIFVPEEEEALAIRLLKYLDLRENKAFAKESLREDRKRKRLSRVMLFMILAVLFSSVFISTLQDLFK
ncbi:DUF2007 domain-containing protein [Eubacterium oxidoreducens]|uniref:Putative signal transducing protein n=1 Tax=Eubacterium oxidoreducens TaxID=1732 RepID=A0A1G6AG69_EUBOX|nr:DUF2007 domain-containing protein [Eubacterium oxidoreducens]SDB07083.1 Putative signal transducing protein [Eubacterium oxidoreducens]